MNANNVLSNELLQKRAQLLRQKLSDSHLLEQHTTDLHMVFTCTTQIFAVPLAHVREVTAKQIVTKIPATPPSLAGVINLRGTIVDVVCLAALLQLQNSSTTNTKRTLIICELPEGSFALAVDKVLQIESISSLDKIASNKNSLYLHGVSTTGDRQIISVLDIEKIFHSPQFDVVKEKQDRVTHG